MCSPASLEHHRGLDQLQPRQRRCDHQRAPRGFQRLRLGREHWAGSTSTTASPTRSRLRPSPLRWATSTPPTGGPGVRTWAGSTSPPNTVASPFSPITWRATPGPRMQAGSGWVRTPAAAAHTYANTSAADYGVNRNAGTGVLSGYAWSTTAGWINFAPTNGGVTINAISGDFSGYAWGENIGWINFSGTVTTRAADRASNGDNLQGRGGVQPHRSDPCRLQRRAGRGQRSLAGLGDGGRARAGRLPHLAQQQPGRSRDTPDRKPHRRRRRSRRGPVRLAGRGARWAGANGSTTGWSWWRPTAAAVSATRWRSRAAGGCSCPTWRGRVDRLI